MTKTFRCSHCNKEFFCKKWDEAEKHIKECPYQFSNPQERFEQKIRLRETENRNIIKVNK